MVVPEWPPNVIGGGGQVFEVIAHQLDACGHEVTVVHGDHTNRSLLAGAELRRDGNLELVRIPLIPTPRYLAWMNSTFPPTIPALLDLRKLLDRPWHVGHLHGVGIVLVDLAARRLRRRRVPYAFTIHGVPNSPLHRGKLATAALRTYLRSFTSPSLLAAAQVTAVSNELLRNALLPGISGIVIPNGLAQGDFDEETDHRSPRSPARLASIARLTKNKGIDIAIAAVAELTRRGISCRYDVYGPDGGDEAEFRSLVASLGLGDIVCFKGSFCPEARAGIFAASDLVLIPSRVEGFGISALEALAAGVPVVSTRADGLADFLDDSNSVAVAPCSESMVDGILRGLDPRFREKVIVGGRNTANRFRWQTILPRYDQLLRDIARRDYN